MIAAEGEQKASRALKEASEVIAESSAALQLRYLQVSVHLSQILQLERLPFSRKKILHRLRIWFTLVGQFSVTKF